MGDLSIAKKDKTQQASFLSTSRVSRCEIVPCDRRNSCHTPDQILQYPFGTPLSEPLEKLKKLVQLNCSPEKVKYLFEQIEAGKVKDTDFEEAMKTEDSLSPESHVVTAPKPNCQLPPCEGHPGCHSADEVLQYPFGTPLPPNLVKLKDLLEQNCSPKKVKFLFEQIEAGNIKDIDWEHDVEISTDSSTDVSPSLNVVPKPISNCRLPPCQGHPPDEILQIPFGTSLSPDVKELKRLIEQNDCPEKVKHLYTKIVSGNMKNVHWKEAAETPTDSPSNIQPLLSSVPTPKTNRQLPLSQGHPSYHPPDEILQYPFGTPLSPDLKELKRLIEQKDCPENVKQLYAKITDGNLKNLHVKQAAKPHTDCLPGIHPSLISVPTPKTNRHLPDEKNKKKMVEQNDCPEKVKLLFGKMEAGNRNNAKSRVVPINLQSNDCSLSMSKPTAMTCRLKPYQECSDSPHETSQQPLITCLPQYQDEPKLLKENVNLKKNYHLLEQPDSGYSKNIRFSEASKPFANLPSNNCPTSKSVPKTPTCIFSSCHSPDEVLQYPYGIPLPPHLVRLKKLLEQNSDPQKVKQLFQKIEAGDLKNIDFGHAFRACPNFQPNAYPNAKIPCPNMTCEKKHGCHSPDEVLQYPFGTPLAQSLEKLKKLIELNSDPKKVKKLYSQIRDGDDCCNLDWEGALENPTTESYPENYPNSKIPCPNITCEKKHGCHSPDEVLQYPFGTPLAQSLEKLKKLIELNSDPKKVKKLYSQIRDGDNCCNLDWEGALENPTTEFYPENYSNSKIPCPNITCEKKHGCHSPDEVLQYPFGTPLAQSLEKLKKLIELNSNPKKVKKLYSQIRDGDDFCNLDCEEAEDTSLDDYPDYYENSKVIPCRTPTCQKNPGCHLAGEVIQYPYGTPLPQPLVKLKTFLEQNSNPIEVKDLLRQIEAGNTENLEWVEALKTFTETSSNNFPNSESISPTISTCHIPPCQGLPNCHLPEEILQYPFGTPLPEHLIKLKKLLEHNKNPKKVQELFRQMEAGNLENLDWNGAMEITTSSQPTRAYDIPASHDHDSYSLDESLFKNPLPPLLIELKKLLEENCSPKIVKDLIKEIESGNLKNMKSVGCGKNIEIPMVITPDICPPSVSTATDSKSLYMPADQKPTSIVLKPGSFPPGASAMVFPPGALTPGVYSPGVSPPVLPPPIIPIVLPPEVYAPAPKDEDCATCHKPKYRDGIKMKCACRGKKKTVKIKPCPCELHKVPMSRDGPGLKIATYSQGAQCCICDDYFARVKKSGKDVIFKLGQSAPSIIGTSGGPVSTGVQGGTGCIICPTGLSCSSEHTTCPKLTTITISPIPLGYYGQPDAKTEMGELEIIGPQGGYVMIGPDGIYTQSGIKVIKFSTGTGTDPEIDNVGAESTSKKKKNCACFNKRGKKKRKVICQCPSESDVEPLLLYTYEDFEEARKLSKQYKSDLTQTTSGFKFNKKKRPEPEPAAEYTVEDAIRDYAIIKPDFIRSLVPPGVRRINKKDCICEEDVGIGQHEILKKNAKGVWELENPEPVQQDVPLKGLKLSIGGKGSGSKGLSGICCFEMYQDS